MEIKIETRFNADIIEQSINFYECQLDNPISKTTKDIIHIKEQGVIDALIALGWTQPKGVTGSKDDRQKGTSLHRKGCFNYKYNRLRYYLVDTKLNNTHKKARY